MLPVLHGGLGFVSSLIGAAVHHLVAGWVGGIEVDLEVRPAPGVPPQVAAPQ